MAFLSDALGRIQPSGLTLVSDRTYRIDVPVGIEDGPGYAQLTVANTIELEGSAKPAATAETVMRVYL